MATTKVNFQDKVDAKTSTLPGPKKVVAADMNEIKDAINNNADETDAHEARITTLENQASKVRQGTWDPASGFFPGTATTKPGYYWKTLAGTLDGIDFDEGDTIVAIVNNPSTTTFAGNWEKDDDIDRVRSVNGKEGNVSLAVTDMTDVDPSTTASKKNNLNASSAPTATDDSGSGYSVGSIWIDTTNDKIYQCVTAKATEAVWLDLTGGGGVTNIQNRIFVSANGSTSDDRVDVVGNIFKPVTPERARVIGQSGDNFYVFAGSYTLTETGSNGYSVDGTYWYFEAGAIWNKATSGPMFANGGFSLGCNVYGHGEFNGSGACGDMYYNQVSSLNWIFEGKSIEVTSPASCFRDQLATFQRATINVTDRIRSTGSIAIWYQGDYLTVNCPWIDSTANTTILRAAGVYTQINTQRLTSTGSFNAYQRTSGASKDEINAAYVSRVNLSSGGNCILNVARVDVLTTSDNLCKVTGEAGAITHNGGTLEVGAFESITNTSGTGNFEGVWLNRAGDISLGSVNNCEYHVYPEKEGLVYNSVPKAISVTGSGSKLYLHGSFVWNRLTMAQSDGEIHIMDHFENSDINGSADMITHLGGKFFVHGAIVQKEDSPNCAFINSVSDGIILMSGSRMIANNQEQNLIRFNSAIGNVKVYGEAFTNLTGFNAAKKQKTEYRVVTDSIATSCQFNGETFIPSVDTAANMRDEIISLINASGTATVTASNGSQADTFAVENDVAGTEIVVGTLTNVTQFDILRENTKGFNLLLGAVTESANVTE
jgi:hypothetical protein